MQKKMNMYSLNTEICHHHLKQLNCPTEWIILTHLTAVNTCISCGYYIWKRNNPNYALLYDNLTFTLSSGCLTTLSERNLVGMKPMTPLSRRVLTPIACPGQEPLSKWFQTWAWKRKKKNVLRVHHFVGSLITTLEQWFSKWFLRALQMVHVLAF